MSRSLRFVIGLLRVAMAMTTGPELTGSHDAADVELTANDLAEIESAASQITIQGARYPEALERMSNR